jgi:hypothetical protein
VHILKTNVALDLLRRQLLAFLRLGVNLWDGIEQLDDIAARTLRRRDIRHEHEDIASLDSTEGRALEKRKDETPTCDNEEGSATYHEADIESEDTCLAVGDENGTIPEDKGNDEEDHSL